MMSSKRKHIVLSHSRFMNRCPICDNFGTGGDLEQNKREHIGHLGLHFCRSVIKGQDRPCFASSRKPT